MLRLLPWELERLTVREFELLVAGYKRREKEMDSRWTFFFTLLVNSERSRKDQIKATDIMNALYPKTKAERKREELQFMQEWEEQGGEI